MNVQAAEKHYRQKQAELEAANAARDGLAARLGN